ncbi:MAG TPA: hypothetical protein DEV93_06410 [Chloroflexi bacterium]|jgi:hypothetical protein|nr:hypothetical protein [Chloroflexota bacterium]
MARRRPQPNARRGLIRAGLTGIVLIIVVVLAVLLVSSLTASTVKAPGSTTIPTPPATPGPLATSTVRSVPTAKPGATATVKAKKQKDVSESPAKGSDHRALMERGSRLLLRRISQATTEDGTVRGKQGLAQFVVGAAGSSKAALYITRSSGPALNAGFGDPYVRPVWSSNGEKILFVSVRASKGFPLAIWSLLQYDLSTHQRTRLATVRALDAEPLGWLRGSPLFTVISQADTSLMTAADEKLTQVSILMPQAVTSAQMSPNGRYISYVVPANCRGTCTLDWFDTQTLHPHFGPTGVPNPTAVGWTGIGRSLFAVIHGRIAMLNAASGRIVLYTLPSNMPARWTHIFRGRPTGSRIVVYDTVSGVKYVGYAR